jgi:hypothetical protein
MFHDTFAVVLGLAGAPIDKASLSFATRQCQTHGALCSSTVHGHGPDATRMRPGCDPDATRTRPGHDPDTTRTRPGRGAENSPSPRPASE